MKVKQRPADIRVVQNSEFCIACCGRMYFPHLYKIQNCDDFDILDHIITYNFHIIALKSNATLCIKDMLMKVADIWEELECLAGLSL